MQGLNVHMINRVFTQRGILNSCDVVPGDMVYEYITNKPLKVIKTKKSSIERVWKVKYNDERYEIQLNNDMIFNGNRIVPLLRVLEYHNIFPLTPHIFTNFNKNIKSLNPNPYQAGMFFAYGDYEDKYINLPFDLIESINIFFDERYQYITDEANNKVYFGIQSIDGNYNKIKWKDYFKNYDFYAKDKLIKYNPIPNEYMYASVDDRIQFIRGVFDIGLCKNYIGKNIMIAHNNKYRLKYIQKILWSLGILSIISYDPYIPYCRHYRLDIVGDYSSYAGLFYNVKNIENYFHNRYKSDFKLNIQSIECLCGGIIEPTAYMIQLQLEKPQSIYVTENYLPRISL